MDTQTQNETKKNPKKNGMSAKTKTETIDPAGRVKMSEDVVATIAAIAARDIAGIHSLGKPRFINFGDTATRGVAAEVGKKQAAIDLDVVIAYGANIHETAEKLRKRLAEEIYKMASREVVEVNINVVDIHVDEDDDDDAAVEQRRVI